MILGQIRDALHAEFLAERHTEAYESACHREPALRRHSSLITALAVLNDEGELRYEEREAVVRALVREYQRTRASLWASALVVAFMPMMLRLRRRLLSEQSTRDELTQRVVSAFLETIATISLEKRATRIALHLRQSTERRVFGELGAERKERQCRDILRDYAASDPEFKAFEPPAADEPLGDQELSDLTECLHATAAGRVSRERIDLVVATCLAGEKLSAFVERTHGPTADGSHRRTYERLKRDRLRTLDKLRPMLVERVEASAF